MFGDRVRNSHNTTECKLRERGPSDKFPVPHVIWYSAMCVEVNWALDNRSSRLRLLHTGTSTAPLMHAGT